MKVLLLLISLLFISCSSSFYMIESTGEVVHKECGVLECDCDVLFETTNGHFIVVNVLCPQDITIGQRYKIIPL